VYAETYAPNAGSTFVICTADSLRDEMNGIEIIATAIRAKIPTRSFLDMRLKYETKLSRLNHTVRLCTQDCLFGDELHITVVKSSTIAEEDFAVTLTDIMQTILLKIKVVGTDGTCRRGCRVGRNDSTSIFFHEYIGVSIIDSYENETPFPQGVACAVRNNGL
jgi:hypothetical protein